MASDHGVQIPRSCACVYERVVLGDARLGTQGSSLVLVEACPKHSGEWVMGE